jgi:putative membrane protein (TIGR04086 family)
MQTVDKVKGIRLFLGAVFNFLLTTAVFISVFAAAIYFLDLSLDYASIFATVSVGLGGFSAARGIAKKTGKKGAATGFLVGLTIFAVITLTALFVNKSAVTLNTLFHFVIIVLASTSGGILGVNKKKRKEYI